MNKILMAVLVFVAIGLIFTGALFMIGGTVLGDYAVGGLLLLLAVIIFGVIWKLEAGRPVTVQQTFNVQMSGSGRLEQSRLSCRSCGAPLEQKDLGVVQGGLMVTCPYCKAVYALEEAPKW